MNSVFRNKYISHFNLRFCFCVDCFSAYFRSSWSLVPILESSLDKLSFFLRYDPYIFQARVTVSSKTCFSIACNSQKWGRKALTVTWESFRNANSQFLAAMMNYQPIRSHLLEITSILKYLLWHWVTNHVAAICQEKIPSSYLFYNIIPSKFKKIQKPL